MNLFHFIWFGLVWFGAMEKGWESSCWVGVLWSFTWLALPWLAFTLLAFFRLSWLDIADMMYRNAKYHTKSAYLISTTPARQCDVGRQQQDSGIREHAHMHGKKSSLKQRKVRESYGGVHAVVIDYLAPQYANKT